MRNWTLCMAVAAVGFSQAGCDGPGERGPGVVLALDDESLRDDMTEIWFYGYRLPGPSCNGHRIAGASGAPVIKNAISPLDWRATISVPAGDWVFDVRGGSADYPVVDPPDTTSKYLAEGCLLRRSVAGGSTIMLTIAVQDRRPEYCGDNTLDPGEQCDDGNTAPGDGCDVDCTLERGICGDSVLNAFELCDDGNTAPGDGCDESCDTEIFGVNTTTNASQSQPAIASWADASGSNGAFVVIFSDGNGDGSAGGVRFRFFGETGAPGPNPVGGFSDFAVNDAVFTGTQDEPSIGWGRDGLLASFTNEGALPKPDIYVRRYDASRFPQGDERNVLETPVDPEHASAVGANRAWSGYSVAWVTGRDDDSDRRIWLRPFGADGSPVGEALRVHPTSSSDEYLPAVAVAGSGQTAVTWVQAGGDGFGTGIRVARFAADGTPSGDPITVNTTTDGEQGRPSLAFDASDHLLVAWKDAGTSSIRARLFGATGDPAGDDFQVSEGIIEVGAADSDWVATSVAASGSTFLVVWSEMGWFVRGRLLSGDPATPESERYLVNRVSENSGAFLAAPPIDGTKVPMPRVAATPGGMAMVVWQESDPPGDNRGGIRGRVLPIP